MWANGKRGKCRRACGFVVMPCVVLVNTELKIKAWSCELRRRYGAKAAGGLGSRVQGSVLGGVYVLLEEY